MNKLRLIVTSKCNRTCEGCCNKDYDLESLPIVESYEGYEIIMLSGGEPMLYPEKLEALIKEIREQNSTAKIYLYTALVDNVAASLTILELVDGLTLTLHDERDINPFYEFSFCITLNSVNTKTLRLNVFSGITTGYNNYHNKWIIKDNMEWIKNCPLPDGEVLMQLKNKF